MSGDASETTATRPGSMIAAARDGDPRAQEEIVQLMRSFARHVCRGRWEGSMPGADWEDVAQEASHKFFTVGIERFLAGGPERSYLYAIVRRTYLQLSRSAWRRRQREETGEALGHGAPNPETRTTLHRILSRLSDTCRELLARLYFDGADYSELAAELRIAESSVRARASRCLKGARELAS